MARYTLELARALASEFPEDEYWLLSDQILAAAISFPAEVRWGAPPSASWRHRRWWLLGLNSELARHRVDVFHGTDFSVPYVPRRRSVMTLHDLSPWRFPEWQPGAGRVRQRTPWLLRLGLARRVITPSEAVRREAIRSFGLRAERVIAVPLAASESFRPVHQPDPPTPYFLFVGTLEPRKNIGRLIEAWQEVRKTVPVDLMLAGRVRADFPEPAHQRGLHVLGAVPEHDLPGLYSGALACVYPSIYEGFGLPVLEAMQCGAIVVTSRDAAIQEVTGGDSAGSAVHVEATDTRALAQALTAIAQAPESFDAVRAQALARARTFTWAATARRTREVYEAARR